MKNRRGLAVFLTIVVVALLLAVIVGFGVYLNTQKNQTLGYKTQRKPVVAKTVKPTYKDLGLSTGNEVDDIDLDMKTINFNGLDAYLSEVSANINTK